MAEGYSVAVDCLIAGAVFLLVPWLLTPFIRSTPPDAAHASFPSPPSSD